MPEKIEIKTDILIIGGGSAGCLAAIRAKELNPDLDVAIWEKGHIRRGGSIAMGMDALNIVAIPGGDTPKVYVEAARIAADRILDEELSLVMARRSFPLLKKLESWGVKFTKDRNGNYTMLQIHPKGKFCAAMEEPDLKVILAQKVKKSSVRVFNRTMVTSLLTCNGRVVGATGLNIRSGDFVVCSAKAVILACGGQARFSFPNSGYLYGTVDYPGNAGDGYAVAFRAGAELTGFEDTRASTLIKDLTCPLLYITITRGAKVVNAFGEEIGQGHPSLGAMLREFREERGPVFIRMDHLSEEKIREIENILFTTERPVQKRFFEQRRIDFRKQPIELYPTEFQLCGGHGLTGVMIDAKAQTSLPGLFAAGDVSCVPKQHLTGAFVFGEIAAETAVELITTGVLDRKEWETWQVQQAYEEVYRNWPNEHGEVSNEEFEFKLRRIITDYIVPPKNETKLQLALQWMHRFRKELDMVMARDFHELSKVLELSYIIDCAELSATASLVRKESRWEFTHYRSDYPQKDDKNWLIHVVLTRKQDQSEDPHPTIEVSYKPVQRISTHAEKKDGSGEEYLGC